MERAEVYILKKNHILSLVPSLINWQDAYFVVISSHMTLFNDPGTHFTAKHVQLRSLTMCSIPYRQIAV